MLYIGIDISKSKLHIAFFQDDAWQKMEIANESMSIQKWIQCLDKEAVQVIFEATGSYGAKLMYLLHLNRIHFTMLNPCQSKGFAQVEKNHSQTDQRDAVSLSKYGALIRPNPSLVAAQQWEKLRQTRGALRQMKKYERMLGNQLHALEQFPFQEPAVKTALTRTLATIREQILTLEANICDLTNDEMDKMVRKIATINGIGLVTARELVISTNGFQYFEKAKQPAKFIGVAPTTKSSGTSVRKKGKISRSGDSGLRGALYMAALSAIRCNNACKELYMRLKDKGKCSKQALVAVAHKLLRQAFALAKSMQDFDNNYYLKFQKT